MPKKTVLLVNHEGHQYDPEYGTVWSDTWAEFKVRRRKVNIGPTLISMTDIERDREMFAHDPEKYGYEEPNLPEGEWSFCLPFGDCDDDNVIPTILINGPWVTKAGIEGAIGWYISGRYGVTAALRFRWKNHKRKFFITPF